MNEKKRAKATLPEIKLLISEKAIIDRNKKREDLADELVKEIKNKYPTQVPPSWETVIKLISAARNHPSGPLDVNWTTGSLKQYPISPEIVFELLRLNQSGLTLTIRQALWYERLSKTIENKNALFGAACIYGDRDRASEIMNKVYPYTDDLDKLYFPPNDVKKESPHSWHMSSGDLGNINSIVEKHGFYDSHYLDTDKKDGEK